MRLLLDVLKRLSRVLSHTSNTEEKRSLSGGAGAGCREDPLLEIAAELERIATQDTYFVSRGLYPNVDFFSGIVLRALGIPVSMFTVLFAVARSVGWIVQWKEMSAEVPVRISRPRQVPLLPCQHPPRMLPPRRPSLCSAGHRPGSALQCPDRIQTCFNCAFGSASGESCLLEPHAALARTTCVVQRLRVDQGFSVRLNAVISGCVGTDLVIYRCFWTEGVMFSINLGNICSILESLVCSWCHGALHSAESHPLRPTMSGAKHCCSPRATTTFSMLAFGMR